MRRYFLRRLRLHIEHVEVAGAAAHENEHTGFRPALGSHGLGA